MPYIYKPTITKYVRVPKELSRRCKLTGSQIEEIKRLRGRKISYKKIADQFGVAKTTIMRHCDPLFRYKGNVSAAARTKAYRSTEEGKKKHTLWHRASHRHLIKDFPPYKRYQNALKGS